MAHQVSPQAEADLDGIWLYIAKDRGSMELATRLVESVVSRFFFMSQFPHIGRTEVLIHRVVHGRRDVAGILAN